MTFLKTGIAACCAILLTSCGMIRDQADPGTVSVRGTQPTLEQLNTPGNTRAQDAFIADLIHKAGISQPLRTRDDDWSLVAEAGIYEIGRQCDQYLDALFRFNREQRAARQGLTAIGAATAAIMGLAGTAAIPIAITAAAFGLSASLFDAGVNSVLFTIEPSALRNIALQGRKNYLDALDLSKINSRPRMMIYLQGYLTQCSPAAIEANINNAASGADSVSSTTPGVARKAAILAEPATTFIQRATTTVSASVVSAPPLQADDRAGNAGASETAISKTRLMTAQRALGVAADGDFGPDTRNALKEFQLGRNRRDSSTWGAVELTGELAGRTASLAPYLSPMPAVFLSPFERAFLGNNDGPLGQQLSRPDPDILDALSAVAGVPQGQSPQGNSADAIAAKMKLLRDRIIVIRTERKIAPDKGGMLDSALYDVLIKQQ